MKPDAEGYYVIPLFIKGESRLGHTYDDVAKAVRRALQRGPIPVTTGPVVDPCTVDTSRICGFISEPKFLEESEIIQGLFKPNPTSQKFMDDLLSPQPPAFSIRQGSPRFGIRGQGKVDKNGKHVIDRIISIDLLPE